jgi:hypothetical protein
MTDRFEHAPDSSPERKRRKPEPKPGPCRSVISLSFENGLLDKELLEFTPNLAHQVNADPRKKPGGLAKELTRLYEFADLHNEGAEGPQDDLLGTVRIDTEPSDQETYSLSSAQCLSNNSTESAQSNPRIRPQERREGTRHAVVNERRMYLIHQTRASG